MQGVITMAGPGWLDASPAIEATVALYALRTYRRRRQSRSVVVAKSEATTFVARDGKEMTIRFTTTVPIIDTSEGRYSWNVRLETLEPKYRATFLIDVA